jgi:hypothetical protein
MIEFIKCNFSLNNIIKQNNLINSMNINEACKILNIENNSYSIKDIKNKMEKYIKLNDPSKGGSFYIQNKIFYAYKTLLPFAIDYKNKSYKINSNLIKIKSKLNNKI